MSGLTLRIARTWSAKETGGAETRSWFLAILIARARLYSWVSDMCVGAQVSATPPGFGGAPGWAGTRSVASTAVAAGTEAQATATVAAVAPLRRRNIKPCFIDPPGLVFPARAYARNHRGTVTLIRSDNLSIANGCGY